MKGHATLIAFACATLKSSVALGLVANHNLTSFNAFVAKHGRSYQPGSQEFEKRKRLFHRSLAAVEEQNSKANRLWSAGINSLSDWTDLELSMLRDRGSVGVAGQARDVRHVSGGLNLHQVNKLAAKLPHSFNWTHLKATPRIVNQGMCGSCWAQATTAMLEMHTEIYRKKGRTFSASELVACAPNIHKCGGTGGCQGSTAELAMDYITSRGLATAESSRVSITQTVVGLTGMCMHSGNRALVETVQDSVGVHIVKPRLEELLATEEIGKVTAPGVRKVKATQPGGLLGMRAWERLPENKQEPLMRALVTRGPVSVSVAAHAWMQYSRGIFDGCSKDSIIDHQVVLIGYGYQGMTNYWTIHNSWGKHWGEKGNMRLKRFGNNYRYCGIDRKPEDGTGCEGGPSEVTICGMCGILYDTVVPHFAHER